MERDAGDLRSDRWCLRHRKGMDLALDDGDGSPVQDVDRDLGQDAAPGPDVPVRVDRGEGIEAVRRDKDARAAEWLDRERRRAVAGRIDLEHQVAGLVLADVARPTIRARVLGGVLHEANLAAVEVECPGTQRVDDSLLQADLHDRRLHRQERVRGMPSSLAGITRSSHSSPRGRSQAPSGRTSAGRHSSPSGRRRG